MRLSLSLLVVSAAVWAQSPAPRTPAPKSGTVGADRSQVQGTATPSPAAKPGTPAPAVTPAPAAMPATAATPAATPAPQAAPGDVVLTIGSEKMTRAEFEQFVNTLPEQYRAQAMGPRRRQVAEQLASMKVLAQEAQRLSLDQKPDFQRQLAFQKENLLAQSMVKQIDSDLAVKSADVQQYYDEHKQDYEQVRARHILIRFKGSPVPLRQGQKELTEEEALAKAQELRTKLQGGGDFAALAKTESDDVGSAQMGGELGPAFGRGSMVPAFEQAAFQLPVGQVSEPVKTQFGYHLIKVEEHKNKTLDEVRADIERGMKPEMTKQAIEELRKKTPVVINDGYFGPSTPAAAPGGAQ